MSKPRLALWIAIGAGVLLNPALAVAAPSAPDQTGWPWVSAGGTTSWIDVADVDYDGDLEVVFRAFESPTWNLYVLNHDGTTLAGFPVTDDVVVQPTLADLDGNGTLEMVVAIEGAGGFEDRLRCYKSDGTILWTVQAACCFRSFRISAIADVDLDGTLDVFCIAKDNGDQWDTAHLLHGATGADFTNWPIDLSGYGRDWFNLADIDGDQDLEIMIPLASSANVKYAFHHDGTNFSGYPMSGDGLRGVMCDIDITGTDEWYARVMGGVGAQDVYFISLPGWPQPTGGNSIPSVCDVGNDGLLEMGFAMIGDGTPDCSKGGGLSYRYNYDGTLPVGWPVCNGNFGSGDQMLIGDTDGDGQLNFIHGAGEGDFSPDGKIVNYKEDGTSATGFPWIFPNPSDAFGSQTGILTDLDLDGDIELGMATENSSVGTADKIYFWDLPVFYNPLNMHWRMAGGNMQHTGEWHPPSYYVPTVASVSPALTWVTSCPVGTLQCSGASFESKPFVWFVPTLDAPDFYGGDLSKGIPAVAVAQPQIHPVTALPQNPLNATYLDITPPALAIGSYELVIQNPTGIRNMVKPVITVTDDPTASAAPVGNTLMVNFGPSDGELAFDWGDVGNTEYVVIYDTAPDGLFDSKAGQTTTNSLTTESPAGTDLFFRVVGVNSCGYGP